MNSVQFQPTHNTISYYGGRKTRNTILKYKFLLDSVISPSCTKESHRNKKIRKRIKPCSRILDRLSVMNLFLPSGSKFFHVNSLPVSRKHKKSLKKQQQLPRSVFVFLNDNYFPEKVVNSLFFIKDSTIKSYICIDG